MKNQYGHQGDVFFSSIENFNNFELGQELKADKSGGITVVEGELTGHHHQFRDPSAVKVFPIKTDVEGVRRLALVVIKPTQLEHYNVNTKKLTKEHDSINFPAGNYIISTQRQMAMNREIQRAID